MKHPGLIAHALLAGQHVTDSELDELALAYLDLETAAYGVLAIEYPHPGSERGPQAPPRVAGAWALLRETLTKATAERG